MLHDTERVCLDKHLTCTLSSRYRTLDAFTGLLTISLNLKSYHVSKAINNLNLSHGILPKWQPEKEKKYMYRTSLLVEELLVALQMNYFHSSICYFWRHHQVLVVTHYKSNGYVI